MIITCTINASREIAKTCNVRILVIVRNTNSNTDNDTKRFALR